MVLSCVVPYAAWQARSLHQIKKHPSSTPFAPSVTEEIVSLHVIDDIGLACFSQYDDHKVLWATEPTISVMR